MRRDEIKFDRLKASVLRVFQMLADCFACIVAAETRGASAGEKCCAEPKTVPL